MSTKSAKCGVPRIWQLFEVLVTVLWTGRKRVSMAGRGATQWARGVVASAFVGVNPSPS